MTSSIIKLFYNWSPKNNPTVYVLQIGAPLFPGGLKVIRIEEHAAAGEGDKWYYDVFFENGSKHRIFNPNEVWYDAPEKILTTEDILNES